MNTTLENSFVANINLVQKRLIQSLSIILVVGLIGNFASCIVFRQEKLRSNAIALLFSAAATFNILVLVYGIGTSLYGVDHISADTYSIVFCKLRLYLRHILLMTVRSYVLLACAASFALSSTSNGLRILCQANFVKRSIVVIPMIWPFIAFHMPVWSVIKNNRCVHDDSYVLPHAIYFFLIVGVIPVVFMILFILLTIRNLTLLHNRLRKSIVVDTRLRTRDRQFIRMLISLVIMYVVTNLYFPSNVLYTAITNWNWKSSERLAIESLIFSITSNYILYINNISPFFLFLISSSAFRKSLWSISSKSIDILLCKRNRIEPIRTNPITTVQNDHSKVPTI